MLADPGLGRCAPGSREGVGRRLTPESVNDRRVPAHPVGTARRDPLQRLPRRRDPVLDDTRGLGALNPDSVLKAIRKLHQTGRLQARDHDGILQYMPADVAQVTGYAEDIRRIFPQFTVRRYLIYIVGRKGYRVFALDDAEA